jgi:hypothetical protein
MPSRNVFFTGIPDLFPAACRTLQWADTALPFGIGPYYKRELKLIRVVFCRVFLTQILDLPLAAASVIAGYRSACFDGSLENRRFSEHL